MSAGLIPAATVLAVIIPCPVPHGVAAISLLHQRGMARSETLSEQPRTGLTSRLIIGQAKGKLAERLGLGMEQAFALLRRPPRRLGPAWHRLTGITSG